jgi:rod shape-determining protein MreC
VLLTTDTASKIPVMIDRTNARAILQGDGGPNPKLDYLRGQNAVREGDRVMTSGDGGVMPRGLPVGTAVKGLDGRWRVVLTADKSPIDFVRILLFEDFTQLANQRELAEKHVPPPTEGALTIGINPPIAAAPAPVPAAPAAKPAATPTTATAVAPAAAKPTPARAADAKPATSNPAATVNGPKPAVVKSSTASAVKADGKSAGAKPSTAKPATAKPATAKPATAKPLTAKPAAAKPAAPKPADDPAVAEPPH